MHSSELLQTYLNRLQEARIYREQGLVDGAAELVEDLSRDIDQSNLPEAEKESLRTKIAAERDRLRPESADPAGPCEPEEPQIPAGPPDDRNAFDYAMVLMDGQFFDEAIKEFTRAALAGHRPMECWEYCGDASCQLGNWAEAIRFYEIVYLNPGVPEGTRQQTLTKITKCTQTLRELEAKPSSEPRQVRVCGTVNDLGAGQHTDLSVPRPQGSPITSLDQFSVSELSGRQICSWPLDGKQYLTGQQETYRILNLLHLGQSSAIFELEHLETGLRFAGQSFTPQLSGRITPQAIYRWARIQLMIESPYLARVSDIACMDNHILIVREYLPLTLVDLLSKEEFMPIPLAVCLAHQILEGIGDLHLLMGDDEQVKRIYHLDLRPSRVLLFSDRPSIRIYNGGLWKVLEECGEDAVALRKLPLNMLSYRAPEQFRTYLARRRPPAFTDIYLFGILFYEMLTGTAPFKASSFEEYEIQHCEQYPTPPKVWRPEIPEELNNVVVRCLECDPMKRWRSPTEISLYLEKAFGHLYRSTKNGLYAEYLNRLKLR
ncbi:MAG: protein kinase [Desulfobacteraceae bacterium]|nr:protein kinase [Desulfobacteraceae bacterium]